MKRLTTFLILIIFLNPAVVLAQDVELTLEDAIAIALRDNRDMLLSAQEAEKAKYKISESRGALFPSLSLNMSEDVTQRIRPKPYKSTYIQAELKLMVFDGMKTFNSVKRDEYALDAKKALLDKTRLETALSVKTAFSTLVLARDFAGLDKKILDNLGAHLVMLEERYKSGQASESDIFGAKASVAAAKKNFEESVNQAEANMALLRNLLYLDESVTVFPNSEFIYEPGELAYDKALLAALEKRPEIRQYEAEVKANKKSVSIAKAGYLPTIYGTWDSYSGDKFLTSTGGSLGKWTNYNVYGVSLSWPIFDGFATRARIEQAAADLKGAQLLKEKSVKDIALELKSAYLSLKDAIARIEAAESDIRLFKDNFFVSEVKFKEGMLSRLDLDDAGLKYDIALFNKEQALYDYIIARAGFDKATGGV